MADIKITLQDFLNETKEFKSGKVEILAAFEVYMSSIKKITSGTEKYFLDAFEAFKNQKV